ncbi:hypothetical protein LTR50_000144 [Elasticomyces elasticus]|nr:hypothetical protein LTR50_000144 [Elasticomyces elasticus]
MNHHFQKERLKPNSVNIGGPRQYASERIRTVRESTAKQPGQTPNTSAAAQIFGLNATHATPASAVREQTISRYSADFEDQDLDPIPLEQPAISQALLQSASPDDPQVDVPPRTDPHNILIHRRSKWMQPSPFGYAFAGSQFDPFGILPRFQDPELDMARLKYECTAYFGTLAMGRTWVPALLSAPHPFLSTLCIGSVHQDAMMLSHSPLSGAVDSIRTRRVRSEVINLILRKINLGSAATDDQTIIAVMCLICSDVMCHNEGSLTVHEQGLQKMVRLRGGLKKLGVNGVLAAVLTAYLENANVLMIAPATSWFSWRAFSDNVVRVGLKTAIIREESPLDTYLVYADGLSWAPNDHTVQATPESPIYCPDPLFSTVRLSKKCSEQCYELLCLLRDMTDAFLGANGAAVPRPKAEAFVLASASTTWPADINEGKLKLLQSRIYAMPPASIARGTTAKERVYEAVRRASVIYAQALVCHVPFSEARTQSHTDSQPPSTYISPSAVRSVLESTDLSDCWGNMAGVLYWIALLTAAASNGLLRRMSSDTRHGRRDQAHVIETEMVEDLKETRKWLVAVAVRCTAVLIFEHRLAVLISLRRMVAVQEILRAGPFAEREKHIRRDSLASWHLAAPTPSAGVAHGFSDYVGDLEGF